MAAVGGPRLALKSVGLRDRSAAEKKSWVAEARLDAILGSCKKTLPSVRCGIRCFMSFVDELMAPVTVKHYFPPGLDTLLAWSVLFRSEGTLANYLGYVKTACLILGVSTQVRSMSFVFAMRDFSLCFRYSMIQQLGGPRPPRQRASTSARDRSCGCKG